MTTCQICEREIKANTGLIAHHGYRRPHGWYTQTQSCFGARFQPYEVACDALPRYIEMITNWQADTEHNLNNMLNDPPVQLTYRTSNAVAHAKLVEVPRPEGFDPKTARPDMMRNSYITLYLRQTGDYRQDIKYFKTEIARASARLKAWKAA